MEDAAFEALAHEDRRQLLSLLAVTMEGDPTVTVPGDVISRTQSSAAMATKFHHVHLPKLASMDYVEWDQETGAVRCGPAFEDLEPLLAVLDEHEIRASD